MLDRGVVDDQVGEHAQPAIARVADRLDDVAEVAQPRVDAEVVGDVVAVVLVGRRVERHQPDARRAEVGDVVDAVDQSVDVAGERLDVEAVDDGVLPPQVAGRRDAHAHGLPGSSNGTRCAELVDEAVAGLVVAAVGAEEALVRAHELLGAVGGERPALLVARARAALLGEPGCGVAREPLGVAAHADVELLSGGAERGVEQPDVHRSARPERRERRGRERGVISAPTRRGSR